MSRNLTRLEARTHARPRKHRHDRPYPRPATQLQAIRDEALRRATSWLAVLPREWRPLDALAGQIAPALGREYLSRARRVADPEPTCATGRKRLAKELLNWLVSAGLCDTHTDSDGQRTFARVRFFLPTTTELPAPAKSHHLGDTDITVRDLTVGDHRRIAAIGREGDDPWGLPNPIKVAASPNGRGVVAVVGRAVVGYAIYTVVGGMYDCGQVTHAEVVRLAVERKWQRKGIAALLLRAAEDRVIREGAAESDNGTAMMEIVVPEPCVPVQILCRGLGYAALGDAICRDAFDGGVDGYTLTRWSRWQL